MTNEQILKKAIEKAIKNGYKYGFGINKALKYFGTIKRKNSWYYSTIFSHDFTKAFFGTEPLNIGIEMGTEKGEIVNLENWQYHLQQMVLKEEPLKYLEKFLW